jgi:high-affinity K+ transport system ATPase subunit B
MSAYDKINKRFTKLSGGQTLGQRTEYWKKEHERLTKELEAHDAEMKRRKAVQKEEHVSLVGGTPVNNVGDGNIAGLGIGKDGEPGVNKKRKKSVVPFKTFNRNPPRIA